MDAYYSFLLDLFPLTDEIAEQNVVLGHRLADVALDALPLASLDRKKYCEQIETLLRLSTDLGYLDLDVLGFLLKELHKVTS